MPSNKAPYKEGQSVIITQGHRTGDVGIIVSNKHYGDWGGYSVRVEPDYAQWYWHNELMPFDNT